MKPHCLAGLALLAGCTSLQTEIEVKAPASAVREVLFNCGDYPKWNPYIVKVDGTVAQGSQIYITVKPPGGPEINASATITSVTKDRLSWHGIGASQLGSGPVTVAIPGVLSARHDFIIEEVAPDRTIFHNNNEFSGAVIPFFDLKPMKAGMEAMNEALKKRAEGGSGTPGP
jgi:hypothetical protein